MMYSGIRAIFRACALAVLSMTHNDREKEVFTHKDLDMIPVDCKVIITYEIVHSDGIFAGMEIPEHDTK